MKKICCLLFLCVFCISIHQAAGQDPYTRLKQTAAQNPVITKQLSKVVIPENDPRRVVKRKQPIPFKPIEMVDLTGRKIDPNETTVINGKTFTAREFFAKLNEIERDQNSKGYSIRDNKSTYLVNIVTPASELDGKVPELSKKIGPLKSENELKSLSPTRIMVGNLRLNPFGQYNDAEKKELSETRFSVNASGGLSASKAAPAPTPTSTPNPKNSLKGNRFNTAGVMNPNQPKTMTTGNPTTAGALKVISDISTKDWSLGSAATFKAGVQASLLRSAKIFPYSPQNPDNSMSEFKINATAKIYGEIHDNSLDLLSGTVELFAPANTSKPMTVKEQIQIAGITIINATENLTQSKTFGKTNARNFDYSCPVDVPICCGVGFTGKVGAKGSVGLNYNCSIFRTVVSLQADPVMDLKGYAEGGASVAGIAKVGVGAEITFLKGDIPLYSYVGLWSQNADQIVVGYKYYVGYDLNMLSGRIYGFADVCCPWIGCHRLGEVNFCDWGGFKSSGTFVEGGSTEVINNL